MCSRAISLISERDFRISAILGLELSTSSLSSPQFDESTNWCSSFKTTKFIFVCLSTSALCKWSHSLFVNNGEKMYFICNNDAGGLPSSRVSYLSRKLNNAQSITLLSLFYPTNSQIVIKLAGWRSVWGWYFVLFHPFYQSFRYSVKIWLFNVVLQEKY